jgi:hypothetical protein
MTTTHALFVSEVERIQSNVVADLAPPGSSSDRGGDSGLIDKVCGDVTWVQRFTAIDNIGHEIA